MGRIGGKVKREWTPSQLSHSEELFELIRDTVNQPIGSGHVEDGANPIDALVEVAEVAAHELTESGSNVQIELVDLRSSGVVHAVIIGTGSADLGGRVDSSRIGTLKPTVVEICFTKDLTIHEFKHTKLIGQNITFSINTLTLNVSGGTIVTAKEQTIFFDRLH